MEKAEVEQIVESAMRSERIEQQNGFVDSVTFFVAFISTALLIVLVVFAGFFMYDKQARTRLSGWLAKPSVSEELETMRSKLEDYRQESRELYSEKIKVSTIVDLERRISRLERYTPYYCDFSFEEVKIIAGEHAGKKGVMQYCVNGKYLVEIDGKIVPLNRVDFETKQKAVEVAQ